MNFDNYLFRCSSLGKLMTGYNFGLTENQKSELARLTEKFKEGKITPKQKTTLGELLQKENPVNELSKTTMSYLEELHKEELLKRNSRLTNKYCEKGIAVEEQSITLYSEVTGTLFLKNKERFNNEYFTGEPDNKQGKIRDLKNSWNYKTFPIYESDVPNSDYDWQMQGYMDLTGLRKSEVVYTLIDTPIKQVQDELRRLDWKYGIYDMHGDVNKDAIPLVVETVSNMIYTEKALIEYCNTSGVDLDRFEDFRPIPQELRYKVFEIPYNEEKVKALKNQVPKWRSYLNELSLKVADQMNVTI